MQFYACIRNGIEQLTLAKFTWYSTCIFVVRVSIFDKKTGIKTQCQRVYGIQIVCLSYLCAGASYS